VIGRDDAASLRKVSFAGHGLEQCSCHAYGTPSGIWLHVHQRTPFGEMRMSACRMLCRFTCGTIRAGAHSTDSICCHADMHT
jgi:hypothetical protein